MKTFKNYLEEISQVNKEGTDYKKYSSALTKKLKKGEGDEKAEYLANKINQKNRGLKLSKVISSTRKSGW